MINGRVLCDVIGADRIMRQVQSRDRIWVMSRVRKCTAVIGAADMLIEH